MICDWIINQFFFKIGNSWHWKKYNFYFNFVQVNTDIFMLKAISIYKIVSSFFWWVIIALLCFFGDAHCTYAQADDYETNYLSGATIDYRTWPPAYLTVPLHHSASTKILQRTKFFSRALHFLMIGPDLFLSASLLF